jgi:tRNA modification GTPase
MFSTLDTIVAVATPPGRGGIGVVRLSGPDAHRVARQLTGRARGFEPRHATLAGVVSGRDGAPDPIDRAIVTFFPAPASYTGDDVVEISAHGSPVVLNAIVAAATARGARVAEPGEFTLRAFLNGRIDLPQAEAVADLIDAATPLQARAAFDQLNGTLTGAIAVIDRELFDLVARLEASVDFPDEGYHFVEPSELAGAIDAVRGKTTALLCDARRGRLIREGLTVAIVGAPNVGKSSVFNALVGAARAIVTPVPGTTRDLVSEQVDIEGLQVTLVDTAGLRDTADVVESEGIARSEGVSAIADLVLVVCDLSDPATQDARLPPAVAPGRAVVVANKADLRHTWRRADAVEVSAATGEGLDGLRRRISQLLGAGAPGERPAITNARHIALVERADAALRRARGAAMTEGQSMPEEFVLADLQEARAALEEITGRRTSDDLLDHIFARFCIGK